MSNPPLLTKLCAHCLSTLSSLLSSPQALSPTLSTTPRNFAEAKGLRDPRPVGPPPCYRFNANLTRSQLSENWGWEKLKRSEAERLNEVLLAVNRDLRDQTTTLLEKLSHVEPAAVSGVPSKPVVAAAPAAAVAVLGPKPEVAAASSSAAAPVVTPKPMPGVPFIISPTSAPALPPRSPCLPRSCTIPGALSEEDKVPSAGDECLYPIGYTRWAPAFTTI